jgi:hypothetical protein
MIQKNFDEITKEDIDWLIENKIAESKTLEYKLKLPGHRDSDKKEFLADISSFANASGGDIIYGIKEAVKETVEETPEGTPEETPEENSQKTGEPDSVVPLQDITADEAKRRLEDLIRNGIEPRVRVQIKTIDGFGDDGKGFVLLVRIPKSFASPHMVTLKGHSRFYARNSGDKSPLDVHEIRSAFLATESQAERIRNFLQDRLAAIMADETPVPLSKDRLILHVIPLYPFLNRQRLDLRFYNKFLDSFRPLNGSCSGYRYNLDGFLTYGRDYEGRSSYCLVFFNGAVEAVRSDILYPGRLRNFLPSQDFERDIVTSVESYFEGYKKLGIEAPFIISAALLGCKGAYLDTKSHMQFDVPIEKDVVIFPEVEVGSYDEEVPSFMRPIFDSVWNAFGLPYSSNYAEDGTWKLRK